MSRSHKPFGGTRLQRGFSLLELLVVLLVSGVLTAIAIPQYQAISRNQRIRGDGNSIAGDVSIAKMRAGADFTQARVYLDLAANSHHVEEWDQTKTCWHPDGTPDGTCSNGTPGATDVLLSRGVTAGFGGLAAPPPNTTAGISQAPACTKDSTLATTFPNTACIVFNSRGAPLNNLPAGLYVTDTNSVYGVTVNASGMVQTWVSPVSGANWSHR
jgi:prepilin-type N-terminal cleavage/methylation domain-containing protein